MNKFTSMLVLAAVVLTCGSAMAQKQVPVLDEKPLRIYALGAGSNSGVCKIDPSDLSSIEKIGSGAYVQYCGSSAGGGGTFLSEERVIGIKYNYGCYGFDAAAAGNGNGPWSADYSPAANIYKMWDMTYEESTGTVYCWYAFNDYDNYLGIYDPATMTLKRVGSASNTAIYALAIDGEGQLWGIGASGAIYTVDKTTGVATKHTQSTTALIQKNAPASACFDFSSGLCYLAGKGGMYDTMGTLWSIDVATGETKSFGKFNQAYYNCLYIPGTTMSKGAPSEVGNLRATFNGEATVVSFTAPTLSIGESALQGDLTYTISVDGVEAATGSVQPGAEASVSINPGDGKHEIAVCVANSEGSSKLVKVEVFSGYDLPGNISDLKAVVDGRSVTLRWTAPDGINGGLLNSAKLRYKVSQGGKVLAENIEATEYAVAVRGGYRQQNYTVTVVYDAVDGQSATVSVMAGEPSQIPYTLNLTDVTTVGEAGITMLNSTTPKIIWTVVAEEWEDPYLQSFHESETNTAVFTRNNFAYLPPVEMKAGVNYTMTFEVAANAGNAAYAGEKKPTDLLVVIARTPTENSADYTVLQTITLIPVQDVFDWQKAKVNITVEEDGNYFIGILDRVDAIYSNNSKVAVKNLWIVATGHAKDLTIATVTAPAGVISPNSEGSLTVKVSNAGYKEVGAGDYTVALFCGHEQVTSEEGRALDVGESTEYTLSFTTDAEIGSTLEYTAVVLFEGDEAGDDNISETYIVKVAYPVNLTVATVIAPDETVFRDASTSIVVKVTNTGCDDIAAGTYIVALMANGERTSTQEGVALVSGAAEDYTFALDYTGDRPATVRYSVAVVCEADEVAEDNLTETYSVTYESSLGVDAVGASRLSITVTGGVIGVKGAADAAIRVFTIDGIIVAEAVSADDFTTPVLKAGVYLVAVGDTVVKIAI